MDFSVNTQVLDTAQDVAVVSATGEIDVATAVPLREALADAEAKGATRIVLDLTDVGFLDSTGLGVLVGTLRRLREVDGELFLVVSNPHVLRVLRVTNLDRVFSLSQTLDEATSLALLSVDR